MDIQDLKCCGNCWYFVRRSSLSPVRCYNKKSKFFGTDTHCRGCGEWVFDSTTEKERMYK
jgi:hypothetical protein